MYAQTANIQRLHLLITKGNKRQRETVAEMIKDIGLTAEDLAAHSPKAREADDLELRAILFAV